MKRSTLFSLLLVFSILAQGFRFWVPQLRYALNKEYFSTTLCENRNNPDSLCAGSCVVKKESKKVAEESKQDQKKTEVEMIWALVPDTFDFELNRISALNEKIVSHYLATYLDVSLGNTSPPPRRS